MASEELGRLECDPNICFLNFASPVIYSQGIVREAFAKCFGGDARLRQSLVRIFQSY